jgi:tRNA 5-methylaminomethyl-2-thiouridine biosynthesis bifunctional protein
LQKISPAIFNSVQSQHAQGRVAWRSHTQDYLPLAGQMLDEKALHAKPPRYNANASDLPWLNGLYVNAGHGSKGMITAPICAELIANLINSEPLVIEKNLASKLNPSRFLLKELGLKQLANSLIV